MTSEGRSTMVHLPTMVRLACLVVVAGLVSVALAVALLPSVQAQNDTGTPTPCSECPTPTPTPTRTPTPDTEFGLQILGGPSNSEATAVAALDPEWLRARVFWANGSQDFAWSDAVVDYAASVSATLILEWWMWSTPAGPGADCSDVSQSEHATFAGELAARYAGRVAAYEVDNEADHQACGSASTWALRFNAVADAIHDADPDAIVIPGGYGYDMFMTADRPTNYPITGGPFRYSWVPYAHASYSPQPDAVAVHHYGCTSTDYKCYSWQRYWQLGTKISNLRGRTGYAGPVWVTEAGEQSTRWGQSYQASRVAWLMQQCRARGVPVCIVYQAVDDPGPPATTWGLFTASGAPKAASYAYATEAAR